ncbi:MAG: Smr/MutS family protein [Deltaproteobacteria bacterium]|jgi:DNA mismatch repair protein MutS2|nr:Smr/MutS family protein [Deltaproteobacteria bacterium]
MRDSTLEAIEFGQALDWLAEIAHSEPGARAALDLRPELTPQGVLANWDLIGQARACLDVSDGPDLRDHVDLRPILSTLGPEGARLNVPEFRAVGLEAKTSGQALKWLGQHLERAPGLAAVAADLSPFDELIESVDRTFGPEGEILDSASPRLAALRQELGAARSALALKLGELIRSEEYKPLLMDDLVTTRNDRFVIPVRASATGRNRGLVHDWSNSGATAYLEPLETVEDNNRLLLIRKEEKREIDRIFARLSALCRELAPNLTRAGAALTKLDLALAEAKLAHAWRAWPPAWAPGRGFNLIAARHPMLERRLTGLGRRMVPLDIAIAPEKPLAVISGINAGGKTVALKTMGLAVALSLAGIIPPVAEGSWLDFPQDVITVMGDGQDLESDLSTFSGHVKALGEALEAARPGVLVLVDEIGSGTDPSEGAALGLAALERLLSSGALILAATHFHLIKSWAALTERAVSVSVNAASTGQPTYGLSYGSPGFSGGLAMAKRLGLPAELIARAEELMDDGQRRAMDLLRRLDEERGALAAERESLAKTKAELEKTRLETQAAADRLVERQNREARELDLKVKAALTQNRLDREALKEEIRKTLARGQRPDPVATSLAFSKMEKALAEARPAQMETKARAPLTQVGLGTEVFLPSLGRGGAVTGLNPERGECLIDVGGLTVRARLNELFEPSPADKMGRSRAANFQPAQAPRPEGDRDDDYGSGPTHSGPTRGRDPVLSVNLIGQTVDEAELTLEKEIDRAIRRGQNHLTVIHGLGTGRLRRGVSDYLRRHPRVTNFFNPTDVPGGAGLTEVDLSAN